jgi:hypothetical protein
VADPERDAGCHPLCFDELRAVEVYERETQEIIKRFLARRIGFPECIAELDAALARLAPRLTGEQLARLRIVALANNEIGMKEMERRGVSEKKPSTAI